MCIYVDLDSDDKFKEINTSADNIHVIKNTSNFLSGIAKAYNECIKHAYQNKIDLVCMFHADMVASPTLVETIFQQHEKNQILSITRIEPPLWEANKEKLIHSLGMYPNEFLYEKFLEVVSSASKDEFTQGCFAPWVAETQVLIESDLLHDEALHSYHEDSDIFIRFLQKNLTLRQTWKDFVYHFTCRGGQFQNGIEVLNQDPEFLKMKASSLRKYHRKWRFPILNDEYQHPLFPRIMYDIELRNSYHVMIQYKNFSDLNLLEFIEPFADSIAFNIDELSPEKYYLKQWVRDVSQTDSFDIASKFHTIPLDRVLQQKPKDQKMIVIEFDEKKLKSQTLHAISCMLFTIIDMHTSSQITEFNADLEFIGDLKVKLCL